MNLYQIILRSVTRAACPPKPWRRRAPRALLFAALATAALAADRHIVFIAGPASHPPLEHEHRATCYLLQKCLATVPGITTEVFTDGWPADDHALDGADTIIVEADGYTAHPLFKEHRLEVLRRQMERGAGLGLIHWAVEAPPLQGEKEFINWTGGAFEGNWSVNPIWKARLDVLPDHEVTRGVKPFSSVDEWCFNMRFRDGLQGVTPILTAVPPATTMTRPNGPRTGNDTVRQQVARGDRQTLMWVADRPDGGRGFGFTGGHYLLNWKDDNQRKVVLNAILWTAHVPVPEGGVRSTVTDEDLAEHVDTKKAPRARGPLHRVVLVAGNKSHPHLAHEYRAGCYLLQKCLGGVGGLKADVVTGGWPTHNAFFDGADAVVFYCDGGAKDPMLQGDHLQVLDALMKKGVGLGLLHWATEPLKDKGETQLLDWAGGAFEVNWSVNPIWRAEFLPLPDHPVTRGAEPFTMTDEFYYHFRFPGGMPGVTPILSAVAPESSLKKNDGLRSGNPAVRAEVAAGKPQIIFWTYDRPGGGRSFSYAGGHNHLHWKDDNQRKLVLNAILWIANLNVPENGVQSLVTDADLQQHLF